MGEHIVLWWPKPAPDISAGTVASTSEQVGGADNRLTDDNKELDNVGNLKFSHPPLPNMLPVPNNSALTVVGSGAQVGGADNLLADYIKEVLRNVPPFPSECCIFKVPVYLRSINNASYTPKLISLGPLHHGEEKLQSMEVHKKRYLHALMHQRPDINLQDLINRLRVLEERARNYYEDPFTFSFTSDQFVFMMLLDGCFIITFLLLRYTRSLRNINDPILNTQSRYRNIYQDMLLLENQLPYFVLEQLYICFNGTGLTRWTSYTFSQLIDNFFKEELQSDQVLLFTASGHQVYHFVDLILKCNLPSQANQTPPPQGRKVINLPSATELHQSGIKFAKGKSNCFLDLKYTNGVIEIPTLCLTDSTEERIRNLIAMEQCQQGGTSYVADYMHLMDFLISTPNDVALLRSCGILDNFLGSDEDAAQLFNNMIKGATVDNKASHYYHLLEGASAHYNKRWNLWKARLRQDYFKNPWTIISFNAAVLLLICTVVQAIFSVLSAKK